MNAAASPGRAQALFEQSQPRSRDAHLIVADGAHIYALADRCSHLSGALSDGDLADGRVTCPWHGSIFRLADGSVARGPATAPQPVFDTRIRDGVLQVCLPGAG